MACGKIEVAKHSYSSTILLLCPPEDELQDVYLWISSFDRFMVRIVVCGLCFFRVSATC